MFFWLDPKEPKSQDSKIGFFAAQGLCPQADRTARATHLLPRLRSLARASGKIWNAPPAAQGFMFCLLFAEAYLLSEEVLNSEE